MNTPALGIPSHSGKASGSETLRRWMLGGTALAGAASAPSAFAAKVEIDLLANRVSLSNGTFASALNLDLTGDGNADLATSTCFGSSVNDPDQAGVALNLGGYKAKAAYGKRVLSWTTSSTLGKTGKFFSTVTGFLLNAGSGTFSSTSPTEARGYLPVKFTDTSINGGAESNGWVEVRAANTAVDEHAVELVRFIFDDESTEAPDLYDGGYLPIYFAYDMRGGVESLMYKGGKGNALLKERLKVLEQQLAAARRGSPRSIVGPKGRVAILRHKQTGRATATASSTRKITALQKQIRAIKKRLRRP